MSCSAGRPTFRLLDQRVGWCDVEYNAATQGWVDIGPAPVVDNLTGWSDSDGIQLLLASGAAGEGVIAFGDLLASLPPRRLARGCGPGSWLLLTPGGMVLRRDPCTGCWRPIWCAEHPPDGLEAARALASSTDRFAIVAAAGVQVWTVAGETQVAEIAVKDAERVAFFPCGDLLVASSASTGSILLQRFGPVGDPLECVALSANITGPVSRVAVDVNDQVWLATGADPSSRLLWSGPLGGQFVPAAAANLAAAFPPTGLIGSSSKGFCLQETGANGIAVTSCSSWDGCPIPVSCVPPPAPPQWQTSGSITSGWIDSGISRCRWHRVRVDADMPMGTGIEISVVTTDFDPSSPTFEKPSSSDWQQGPAGALDVLVQQPPGQFLQLSLVLTSDGTHTPVVRSVRIDFPRRTSLDWLPAVYRENVEAEDFTERFLANFDSSIDDVDAAIARFPALLETNNVPGQVLPWLGSFLDVVFDPTWPDTERRKILNTLPTLYAQRGTLAGLSAAILLIFGVNPAIRELATERSWGARRLVKSKGRRPGPAQRGGRVSPAFRESEVTVPPRPLGARRRAHSRIRQPRPGSAQFRGLSLRDPDSQRDDGRRPQPAQRPDRFSETRTHDGDRPVRGRRFRRRGLVGRGDRHRVHAPAGADSGSVGKRAFATGKPGGGGHTPRPASPGDRSVLGGRRPNLAGVRRPWRKQT